jgi:outer membrane protein
MRLKLLTLALSLAAVSLPSHGEDLMDAYRQARANDPVLAQADAQRAGTHEGIDQARSALLPQLSASGQFSQSSTGGSFNAGLQGDGTGHSRSRNLSATLTQSVFNLNQIANLRAAHSSASAQDELYAAAEQNLYVRVTTAYFNVLTAEDQLSYAKANEDAYKQQYDQANQRFKVGLSAITDVYQAKSYYEAAKAQTLAAQNTLDDAREALTQITGKPVGDLKKLRDDLPLAAPTPADPNAWVQQALENNPNVLSQQYNVEAAEHSVNAARANHLPTLSASLSRGKDSSWPEYGPINQDQAAATGNGRYGTTIGLTLTVPLFSGGYTQSVVRQSIDQRDAAQDSLESERRQVKRDTLNYYRSVLAGISQVQSGKAAVESGEKALDATRAGFQVGTQTMTDVLLAIQTLTSAESTYSQNRHQFILDKLLLKQAAGTADLKDLETINALLQ